ncbi:hypothetical protein H072_2831 [Dactylellina haptotyla CBS 200.50]|uniref:Uncharacterized protein n=1 Tax=Dactylellina haptotyla (strain CBS 200.50) TaxID=1284197 RepID=S8AJT9_DACHA|nr:hypothetical protein H072_2831 [Dactylellina haptotyla CBS 200.50]
MDTAERSPDSITSPVHAGDDVNVLDLEEEEMDARTMSPRRNSEEMERYAAEAKERLEKQAKLLQESLLALLDRVDKVREEHDKLEGENKFLQDYIGHLMQTSKITGPGGIKSSSNRGK